MAVGAAGTEHLAGSSRLRLFFPNPAGQTHLFGSSAASIRDDLLLCGILARIKPSIFCGGSSAAATVKRCRHDRAVGAVYRTKRVQARTRIRTAVAPLATTHASPNTQHSNINARLFRQPSVNLWNDGHPQGMCCWAVGLPNDSSTTGRNPEACSLAIHALA